MENIFADRLREAITKRKVKPADLADAVGLGVKTIYAFMQGRIFPSLDKFEKIADALDVSSDFLLGKVDDYKGIILDNNEDKIITEVLFIRRAYQELSEKNRKLLMSMARLLLYEYNDNEPDPDTRTNLRLIKTDKDE